MLSSALVPSNDRPPAVAPLCIAHLAAPGEVGGLERVLVALATGQAAAGHRVRAVLVLDHADAAARLVAELRDGGVGVDRVVVPHRAYLAERREVGVRLRAFGARVVHSHGYRADLVDAPAARAMGARTVTTVHGFTGGGWRNRLYEAAQRRVCRRFDAVIAVSRGLHDQLAAAGVPRSRLHCLPNAYAPRALPSAIAARVRLGLGASARPRVGWVGRLSREKGADVLLHAAAHPAFPTEAQLSIVGDGPELGALRLLARRLGVEERVAFHGVVPDARDVVPAFDCFVLSSRTEGTPVTLFEAMDAGVPVVATRVGGVPDVVGDGLGLLVPPDDPAAIAHAVRAVVSDGVAARRRAVAARRTLLVRFAADAWLERHDALYRSLAPAVTASTLAVRAS